MPQEISDVGNKTLLHYYGKGWYKWYHKNVFEDRIEKSGMFGTDAPIIKSTFRESDPWTDKVSPGSYEKLFK